MPSSKAFCLPNCTLVVFTIEQLDWCHTSCGVYHKTHQLRKRGASSSGQGLWVFDDTSHNKDAARRRNWIKPRRNSRPSSFNPCCVVSTLLQFATICVPTPQLLTTFPHLFHSCTITNQMPRREDDIICDSE